jgi:hypothetical protein
MSDTVVGSDCAHRDWQTLFEAILPSIQNCVSFAFRDIQAEQREEMIQESIANAAVACASLVARGHADRVFPTALAAFAVRQTREGRKVGGRLNSCDVLSRYCQWKKCLAIRRLDRSGALEGDWKESIAHNDRTPVLDQVAFRLDFAQWLRSLSDRQQQIALALAVGRTTNEVAGMFAISVGRVSQLRRQFHDSWHQFHAEMKPALTSVGARS